MDAPDKAERPAHDFPVVQRRCMAAPPGHSWRSGAGLGPGIGHGGDLVSQGLRAPGSMNLTGGIT